MRLFQPQLLPPAIPYSRIASCCARVDSEMAVERAALGKGLAALRTHSGAFEPRAIGPLRDGLIAARAAVAAVAGLFFILVHAGAVKSTFGLSRPVAHWLPPRLCSGASCSLGWCRRALCSSHTETLRPSSRARLARDGCTKSPKKGRQARSLRRMRKPAGKKEEK